MGDSGEQEISIQGGQPLISLSYENSDGVLSTGISITVSANTIEEAYAALDKVVDNIINSKLSHVKIRGKHR